MAAVFPDSEEGLKALPGIGDYTAAAIAAIAFNPGKCRSRRQCGRA
jgi:adenine-specific DNA glycosylase